MPPSKPNCLDGRTAHLVDPILRQAIAEMPDLNITEETLPQIRDAIKMRFSEEDQPDPCVEDFEMAVPGPNGDAIRVVGCRPAERDANARLPALLHMHGGGFMIGAPEIESAVNRMLAREAGCAVYSVDYRLAPEHRFPDDLDDGYAVLAHLFENAVELGLDDKRIGVKGESAGGCLASGLALRARDEGKYALAFQALTFPMLDDRTGGDNHDAHPYAGEFLWTGPRNALGWRSRLGDAYGSAEISARAAPARAEDLTGLPATFIAVGALDLFLDENLEFTRRLGRAGVPIELHVYPGAVHGFSIAPGSWIEKTYRRDLANACRKGLRVAD